MIIECEWIYQFRPPWDAFILYYHLTLRPLDCIIFLLIFIFLNHPSLHPRQSWSFRSVRWYSPSSGFIFGQKKLRLSSLSGSSLVFNHLESSSHSIKWPFNTRDDRSSDEYNLIIFQFNSTNNARKENHFFCETAKSAWFFLLLVECFTFSCQAITWY